jgi:toxin ParE1/3/4
MNVKWTDVAVEHLAAINAYLEHTAPDYALRVVDRLTRRSQQIGTFPYSGRPVSELNLPNVREVIEGPYRIIYVITSDGIDILAVMHGSRPAPWRD